MNILPHHVAATLLLGGLTIGGYCAFNALTPPSLENHLESLNLELVSDNWSEKATNYKKKENNNLITSISKDKQNNEVEELLKKWCGKKREKYFLGNEDETYKNFSLWCTVTKTIENVLSGRNLKNLDTAGWEKKVESYNAETNTDKFTATPSVKGTAEKSLQVLCQEQKRTNYLYEGHEILNKILKWCYA